MSGILQMFSYISGIVKKWIFEKSYTGFNDWSSISGTSDGLTLITGEDDSNLFFINTTGNGTFTSQTPTSSNKWTSIVSAKTGSKTIATGTGIFIRNGSGPGTWTAVSVNNKPWGRMACSDNGSVIAACTTTGTKSLYVSTDYGKTWYERYSGVSSVALSSSGAKIVACVKGGRIYTSINTGIGWTARDSNRQWEAVASSSDGVKLVACVYGGQIYTSVDSGVTWVARESNRDWRDVASSSDGVKLVACVAGGQIYTSVDSGVTWVARESNRDWYRVASSSTGSILYAGINASNLYKSIDSGVTWTATTGGYSAVNGVVCSDDGTVVIGVGTNSQIRVSVNGGSSWYNNLFNANRGGIACSSDGVIVYCGVNHSTNGLMVTSTNKGTTWTDTSAGVYFHKLAAASDLSKIFAIFDASFNTSRNIYVSNDSGSSWVPRYTAKMWVDIACSGNGVIAYAVEKLQYIYKSTNSGVGWVASWTGANIHWRKIICSSSGNYVYAFGSGYGTLITSNAGTSWIWKLRSTHNWYDAVCSSDGSVIIGSYIDSTDSNVYGVAVSTDYGTTWSFKITPCKMISLFCSDDGSVIYGGGSNALNTSRGVIYKSLDLGSTWSSMEPNKGWSSLAASSDASIVYACSNDGIVKSTNYGVDFLSITSIKYIRICCSDSGGRVYILRDIVTSLNLGVSNNYGATIAQYNIPTTAICIDCSGDGSIALIGFSTSLPLRLITSSNSLISTGPSFVCKDVAVSPSGNMLLGVGYGVKIYMSIDSGATWSEKDSIRDWSSIDCSDTGEIIIASANGDYLYVSTDSGATWNPTGIINSWVKVKCSLTGETMYASASSGSIYFSTDYGVSWKPIVSQIGDFPAMACSADGTKLITASPSGSISVGS